MDKLVYETMSANEARHWWFVSRAEIVEEILNKYFPIKKNLEILDVGCGSGGNFKMLSRFGKITGIEPDEFAVKEAEKKKIAKLVLMDDFILNNKLKENSFDLIVLTDVLEHIEMDNEALIKIYKLLKKNGILLITVPAGMNIWSKHDETHHHFRRYSKKELKDKLTRSLFIIEQLSYFNFFLYPIVFIERKLKLNKNEDDVDMSGGVLNSLLKAIFSSEKYWLRKKISFPIGVSLITVCRK